MNILSNAVIDMDYFDYVDVKEGEKQNHVKKGDLFFNTSSETGFFAMYLIACTAAIFISSLI